MRTGHVQSELSEGSEFQSLKSQARLRNLARLIITFEFLKEHVIISSYPFQYVLIIEHRNHHPSIGFYDQHCVPGLVFL
jgi:hypothetical protein